MSHVIYWKVSAALLLVTITLHLPTIIILGSTCTGDPGHCGG
jgi:hypothetical protein